MTILQCYSHATNGINSSYIHEPVTAVSLHNSHCKLGPRQFYIKSVFVHNMHQGFFQGGRREHLLLLGLILPPLGNFILKVNQFKCLKYLVIALCILSVNKSLKYCMYVYHSRHTDNNSTFSTPHSITISKSSSINNELISLFIIL